MQSVRELERQPSPAPRPQPLAFYGKTLWMGSWDTNHLYAIDPHTWRVLEEVAAPGKPYGLAALGAELRVVVSIGEEDDRYLYRFVPGQGFDPESKTACPGGGDPVRRTKPRVRWRRLVDESPRSEPDRFLSGLGLCFRRKGGFRAEMKQCRGVRVRAFSSMVEHRTFNPLVLGSSPRGRTSPLCSIRRSFPEGRRFVSRSPNGAAARQVPPRMR